MEKHREMVRQRDTERNKEREVWYSAGIQLPLSLSFSLKAQSMGQYYPAQGEFSQMNPSGNSLIALTGISPT